MLVAREGGSGSAKMMFRLWGNDVPVAVKWCSGCGGIMFRLWWNDVPVAVEWCSGSGGGYGRWADRYFRFGVHLSAFMLLVFRELWRGWQIWWIFSQNIFFIMFAKHHFIIEWCLADKILPQIAQIGTDIGRRRIRQKKTKLVAHPHKEVQRVLFYIYLEFWLTLLW